MKIALAGPIFRGAFADTPVTVAMNLFLTPDGHLQPRWLEAFPDAVTGAPALAAGASVVWLMANHPRYAEWLPKLVATGRPVVVISLAPDQEAALAALAAGARGYCHALAVPEMLQDVAAAVAHGGLWVGPDLMNRLIRALPGRVQPPASGTDHLTERERETALLVARGLANKEIARELNITERTVKAHLSAIFAKLGLRDRLQLALRFKTGAKE